jgi:hypothetical protein
MDKKNLTSVIAIAVIVGITSFFGGYKLGQKNNNKLTNQFSGNQNFAQRQQANGQFRTGSGTFRNTPQNGGFISGEILSKDDKSLTIKMRDGGSKIIFYSGNTQINKAAVGTISDLEAGKEVTVMGTPNSDGTISAQNIQLRSIMPAVENQAK